jgi:rhodanese-related sulfurtransferase
LSTDERARPAARSIADVLSEARTKIRRLSPEQVRAAAAAGAVVVDIRPIWQRAEHGHIPGALIIERNHLEWRLDPASDTRIRQAAGHDVEVIVACQEGYTSSLAAAALVDLGLHRTADLEGGYLAWRDAGLPTEPGPDVAYRGEDLAGPAADPSGR